MNDAIMALERDRMRILGALHALEHHMDQLLQNNAPGDVTMADFSRFFRLFGDVHFATKVDDILLPDLVRCKAGLDMDVVSEIRAAHELQQYHLLTMEQYVDSASHRDNDSRRALVSQMQAFIESQRRVCTTLETAVFPLVDKMTSEEQQGLKTEIEQFDRASIGRHERADLTDLYERLLGANSIAAVISSRRATEHCDSEPQQSGVFTD